MPHRLIPRSGRSWLLYDEPSQFLFAGLRPAGQIDAYVLVNARMWNELRVARDPNITRLADRQVSSAAVFDSSRAAVSAIASAGYTSLQRGRSLRWPIDEILADGTHEVRRDPDPDCPGYPQHAWLLSFAPHQPRLFHVRSEDGVVVPPTPLIGTKSS